ncbi:hypothetical protein [Oryza sativa Japonica Group]|uniref:Uncharacterized protein n=1 Tax=Oryza sativa subsp. japonica TaxID=39947 RepID=Q5QM79_ORYSJ|nr:hypothetical protein [Oryza sativa Japonica Group]
MSSVTSHGCDPSQTICDGLQVQDVTDDFTSVTDDPSLKPGYVVVLDPGVIVVIVVVQDVGQSTSIMSAS